jgi:hypothetical protein
VTTSSDQSRKEGGFLSGEDLVLLTLALAARHVHRRPAPPEDEEDVLHCGETSGACVNSILLGLVLFLGDAVSIFLSMSHCSRVWLTGDLWYRHGFFSMSSNTPGPRWGSSRALAGRVDSEGLVVVLIAPLLTHVAARLLALLAPLLCGFFGLVSLHRRIVHVLDLLPVENSPHRLLFRSEAGGDAEQPIGVDRWPPPKLAHKFSAGHSLEEGVHDLRLSDAREVGTVLGEAPYEISERLTRPLGACPQVLEVPMAHVCALEVPHKRVD